MKKQSRRKFIAGSTIAVAGLGVFGLIGYGKFGKTTKNKVDIKMLSSDEKIYHEFIEKAAQTGMNLPEHELKLPMFQTVFTPGEAEFLNKFSFLPKSPEKLADKTDMSVDELLAKMKPFISKGAIRTHKDDGETHYALETVVFYLYRMPWWTGRDDDYMRKLAVMTNRYYSEAFVKDHNGYPTLAYRAVPIRATVENNKMVMPYDDVVEQLKTRTVFTVSHCSCKTRHNLDPAYEKCRHPTEVCMHFDALGEYIAENKMGRVISLDEAFDIVTRANESGLVHGTPVPTAEFDTLCNCCKCCCLFLEKTKAMPVSAGHTPSNYISSQGDQCEACGTCEDYCPREALKLDGDDQLHFAAERCIGCGVCVHHCPVGNIKLVARAEPQDYPKDTREMFSRMCEERGISQLGFILEHVVLY
ncbi:MAG: 4Fe-4S dicluster domain-containing protein [Proteobacteria bacterium]|nr:4Fe-4S dicluster domain-containing protein [Pseudomonadota bacterium]